MRAEKFSFVRIFVFSWFLVTGVSAALAIEQPTKELEPVDLEPHLGQQIRLSSSFTSSTGQSTEIGDLFLKGKPLVVIPAYYTCPRLCGLVLTGVAEVLSKVGLELGKDYRVITASFNPKDTPEKARKMAEKYRALYSGEGDPSSGWEFLVGSQENIDSLMGELGFRYIEDKKEYAHTAAFMILTPDGRISQYFPGVQFPERDVRLALVEASEGTIGTFFDQALLFCFRFDPTKGRYTMVAFNVVRAGGGVTLVLLGGLMLILWRREIRRKRDTT